MRIEKVQHASGKLEVRYFDLAGNLERELHRYGQNICLLKTFEGDGLVDEAYVVDGKDVSRVGYERARAQYVDMPAAGTVQPQKSARQTEARDEKRAWVKELSAHVRDSRAGEAMDRDCMALLELAEVVEAGELLRRGSVVFGSPHERAYKRLIGQLYKAGSPTVRLVLTSPDGRVGGCVETIVVGLPSASTARRLVLKVVDDLARLNGEKGWFDDGQSYCRVDT